MSLQNGFAVVPCIREATIKLGDPNHVFGEQDYVVLIMGPTGAGKSRFVEALAGNDSLGISRDQLESYTQTITTYELVDIWVETEELRMKPDIHTHIIDSPGFSDSEISELKIIEMLDEWMNARKINIHTILYLCPITDTRVSGSKRRTIEMLKMLGGIDTDTPGAVYVVTTMWDRIWNERGRMAAEERFAQLRDDIWEDLPDTRGAKSIYRFLNTHESALAIISATFTWTVDQKPRENLYDAYDMAHIGPLNEARFTPHLYRELLDRIENVHQQKQNLELELSEPEVQANVELKSLLGQRRQNVDRLLVKFEKQLVDFGEPPVGFEDVAPLREALASRHYPTRNLNLVGDRDQQSLIRSPSRLSIFKRAFIRGIKSVKGTAKRRK